MRDVVRNGKNRNRRRKYRRRKTGFIFAVFSFLIILAAVITASTVFFKISEVEITGDSRYTDEQILEASGITVGTNMFLINKFSAINHMFSKLVYLDEIRIRRRLPDTIEIIVSDTEAVACIESSGSYWAIDKRGKLLETVSENEAKAMGIVAGIKADNPEAGKIIEPDDADKLQKLTEFLNAAYDGGELSEIGDIDFEKMFDVSFRYNDRFTVLIGEAEDYERKFRFLKSVIERLSPTDRGVIDLSDPETARFRPEAS